jgi:hypothetical protein
VRLPVPGDNYIVLDVMAKEVVSVSPSTALLDAGCSHAHAPCGICEWSKTGGW